MPNKNDGPVPHWEEMGIDHVARWLDVLNSERRDLALEYKLLEEEGLEFPQVQTFVRVVPVELR